ncbi:PEP-CTERM sorting domain-containing protein [Viridibacterium curvum]|uniref:Ice-binding protein C-terminal domain-containing protein n=1 Tax=Viridibacterium curvum TaxID=1101404 RepID=A0ABP9QKV5_9RHOO
MNQTILFKLLGATAVALCCSVAQAARLEVVDHLAAGGYIASTIGGEFFSDDAIDLSAGGDVGLIGTHSFDAAGLSHGYVADAYFIGNNQSYAMSITQYLTAAAGKDLLAEAFVSVPLITLNIASEGEALGSPVQVSFNGLASALGLSSNSTLQMDIAITSGSTTLGSWLWAPDAASSPDAPVSFSFLANVGQQITLSAFMHSTLGGTGSQAVDGSVAGMLGGNFAVAAVPEASNYAMLLAGLGILGLMTRRRV